MKSMKKALSILLAMCLLLGMLPMSLSASAADDASLTEVFLLVNQERAKVGKAPYKSNANLNAAAVRAKELADKFDHIRPDGRDPETVLKEHGITSCYVVGENIGAGYSTAASAMNGWMNSSGHKSNILDEGNYRITHIGIGRYGNYWVQLFVGSNSLSDDKLYEGATLPTPTPKPTATPVPKPTPTPRPGAKKINIRFTAGYGSGVMHPVTIYEPNTAYIIPENGFTPYPG